MEETLKILLWIILFFILLGAIYFALKKLGI